MKLQILAVILVLCLTESLTNKTLLKKPPIKSYPRWVTQMMSSVCACCKRKGQNENNASTSFALQSFGSNCYRACKKFGAKCCQGLKYNYAPKRRPFSITHVVNACHPRANWRRVNYCCCIDCQTQPAEIIFVLDNSGSIDSTEYTQMMNFVKAVVNAVEVGPTKKHIGVITFASSPQIRFHLNDAAVNLNNAAVITALGYPRQGGGTNIAPALQAVTTSMVTEPPARPGVAKFVIVITDGNSANAAAIAPAAAALRAVPTTIIAVGIGGANIAQLNQIASPPVADNVLSAASFSDLMALKERLVDGLCD